MEGHGGNVIVRTGNAPWGGLHSQSGNYFLSIQGQGAYVEQAVCGLIAGQNYKLIFAATHRPGYGNDEKFKVTVNGKTIWSAAANAKNGLPDKFGIFQVNFKASGGDTTIRFENDSPTGDKSVFLDAVQLVKAGVQDLTATEVHRCEGSQLVLQCPGSGKIKVTAAAYGRVHGKNTCPHTAISNQKCKAASSKGVVSKACDGKAKCTVSVTNNVFGDPCAGTYKYLTVSFTCGGNGGGGSGGGKKCVGDIVQKSTSKGRVDVEDLLGLLAQFGNTCKVGANDQCNAADISTRSASKGKIDVEDLLALLAVFGQKCA